MTEEQRDIVLLDIQKKIGSMDTRMDKMDTNINTRLNEIDKKVSEMHFKLFEWEPILDYAQKYTTTHIVKIASLRKKVESNKKGLANHEKRISLLESKKVLNQ